MIKLNFLGGGWTPNNDPWATGASFHYAYPITTPRMNPTYQAAKPFEPFRAFQPKPPAPSFATFPTPEWEKWKPGAERTDLQQQQQRQAPSANGNDFWNIFNNFWNRNKQQTAPSLFHNSNLNKPSSYFKAPPEPMQTKVASSMVEYHAYNNQPFQSQTSAFQTGINNPPQANFIVSSNTEPGTFQGQLNALNNNEGTSFLYIDGKPYVIRRVINRFSNTFTPGQLNIGRLQPFQRFGPSFLRGDQIPHIVRQALQDSQAKKAKVTPENLPGNQKSSLPSQSYPMQRKTPAAFPRKAAVSNRNSPTAAWQRFNVNKPNYMQMYANYVRSRSQSQPMQRNLPSHVSGSKSETNRFQTYSQRPYMNAAQNIRSSLYNREQTGVQSARKPMIRAGSKYAISIKGIPGSSAAAAIRNKAVINPGFLSRLLSSRSTQFNRPSPAVPQLGPKRNSVIKNRLIAQKRPYYKFPTFVNRPLTDRALLRTKIIRPLIWKPRWAKQAKPRTNIAYLPRSAFNRLPSWYRPKIGPALVKYVVKAKGEPQGGFYLGNKKQSMIRPAARDVWQKIYSFYNRKNDLLVKQMQDFARKKQNLLAREIGRKSAFAKSLQDATVHTVNVGSPLLRVRDGQNPNSNKVIDGLKSSEGFKLRLNTGVNTYNTDVPTKDKVSNSISPEMWDKRSNVRSFLISKKNSIPHRPTIAGNWGTLKKRRSASITGHHHHHHHHLHHHNHHYYPRQFAYY